MSKAVEYAVSQTCVRGLDNLKTLEMCTHDVLLLGTRTLAILGKRKDTDEEAGSASSEDDEPPFCGLMLRYGSR